MGIFDAIWKSIFGSAQGKSERQPAAEQVSPLATDQQLSKEHIETLLDEFVTTKGQNLKWRTSVIDLMKVLSLDSSLVARKKLARKIGFAGDDNNSTAMNLWLHKELLQALSKNGGDLPQSYRTK
uniref:DUF3597 domain-containing protein n=1 Tax=Ochrobactrum sp. LM19 TaxID=1449781 RepID=A0A0D5A153_9HYPH|nr:DUF3597 domain-containing protein [Ochrobactrum sp. LM19]AJW29911.1 hypothetical protein pLM19O1_p41 [Ochrobactrum sp. LM19]